MSEIQINQNIDEIVQKEIMAVRNQIVTAFIAEFGCKPSEVEIVENVTDTDTGQKLFWYVRKRIDN